MGVIQNAVNQALGAAAKASVGIKGLKELEANKNAPNLESDPKYIKSQKKDIRLQKQIAKDTKRRDELALGLKNKTVFEAEVNDVKEAMEELNVSIIGKTYQREMGRIRREELKQKYEQMQGGRK